MAQTIPLLIGIDVSSNWLDIDADEPLKACRIDNTPEAINVFLDDCGQTPLVIALESTGRYHETIAFSALARGHRVYLVDAGHLRHYRQACGVRSKTDASDASLLRRYLRAEQEHLRPLQALDPRHAELIRCLHLRGTVVRHLTALRLSLEGLPEALRPQAKPALAALVKLAADLQRQALRLARLLGWQDRLARLQTLPGIGPLSALILLALHGRGQFRRADQFVAFLGLDIRLSQSGQGKARGSLSKRGDPEARRILYTAAMAAARGENPFAEAFRDWRERGFSATQAYVTVSRKLVRVAFSLLASGQTYQPEKHRSRKSAKQPREACEAT